jgi:hypothetical protein
VYLATVGAVLGESAVAVAESRATNRRLRMLI